MRSIRHLNHLTLRAHQSALPHFTSYVANPDYSWDRVCEQRFSKDVQEVPYGPCSDGFFFVA